MKRSAGVALALMIIGGPVQAACHYYDGTGPVVTSASLEPQIVVSTLADYGQILYTRTFSGRSTGLECTQPSVLDSGWLSDPGAGTPLNGVYATNLSGIGMRIEVQTPTEAHYWPRRQENLAAGHFTPSASYLVTLVKTGPIQEGRLLLRHDAVSRRYGALEATKLQFADSGVEVVLNKPTCTVAPGTQTIPVDLGEHRPQDFSGPGSGTRAESFRLRLVCQGGQGGDRLFVHVTLSDATDPGNRSAVLSLRPDATARGIGVQVLRGEQPVSYGADSSQVGNPGQWFAGSVSAADASFEVPLTARYIQVGNAVTPGSAGALATFTFAYN